MRPLALLLAGCCLVTSAAEAQVYRWLDERGRVYYGNAPPPGAIQLELRASAPALQAPAVRPTSRGRDLPGARAPASPYPGAIDAGTVDRAGRTVATLDCAKQSARCAPARTTNRSLPQLSALHLP